MFLLFCFIVVFVGGYFGGNFLKCGYSLIESAIELAALGVFMSSASEVLLADGVYGKIAL